MGSIQSTESASDVSQLETRLVPETQDLLRRLASHAERLADVLGYLPAPAPEPITTLAATVERVLHRLVDAAVAAAATRTYAR